MTLFVQSADGTTAGAVRTSLPARFTRKLDGTWSVPTAETAADFGWYPVTVTAEPDHDAWDSVTRSVVHDGDKFVTEWTVTRGVEPLVDPAEWPADDERVATDALLTEDSVGYRAVLALMQAKHNAAVAALGLTEQQTVALSVTDAEVAAVQAVALQRLVTLADNPEVRREMIAGRIARAEAARTP